MGSIADERFMPREFNIPFDPFMRHFERYFTIVKMLGHTGKSQKWLDCACGTGYGTNLLTNFVEYVVGYDINKETVCYANQNYRNDYCQFTSDISRYKSFFDTVVSVETVEHMPQEDAKVFLNGLYECLKANGCLMITTPIVKETNRSPINKFHSIEYSDEDFIALLSDTGFKVTEKSFIETKFTDGETKDQGYYKCQKLK
tara:strand:- start:355 stop:957 length:603 start_codon:yes stop_codon:yes gene_type:complete